MIIINNIILYYYNISYGHCVTVIIVSLGKVVCADLVRRSTLSVHADNNKTYSLARHCPMETAVFGFVCQCYTRTANECASISQQIVFDDDDCDDNDRDLTSHSTDKTLHTNNILVISKGYKQYLYRITATADDLHRRHVIFR